MEVYPASPSPSYPLPLELAYKTLVSPFESGKEQRRQVWAFPKRSLKLGYKALSDAEIKLLYQFYMARKGSLEAFWFFYPVQRSVYGEYVGLGTGGSVTLDLPSKNTVNDSSFVLYEGATPISKTFVSGGGQGGSDRVTFTATSGAVITADFQGQLRLRMRFVADKLSDELFTVLLYKAALELLEAK